MVAAGGGDYPLVPPHPAAGITLQAVQTALLLTQTVAHLIISNLVEVAVLLVGVAQPSEQLNTLLNSLEEIGE